MYGGRIRFASPMLFACGFLSMFLIGGLTGIMLAAAPFDFQLSDSYFVVGHFHWVLIGGTLFGTFAGLHYWYPKVTGRMLSERLARWQFWLLYIGFHGDVRSDAHLRLPRNAAADLHVRGQPRLGVLNQLTTLGALIQAPSFAIFVYNVIWSYWKGPAGRRRSVERLDAGVGHDLPAPFIQFRSHSDRAQPPAAVGLEAPGRSGLEIRMNASPPTTVSAGRLIGRAAGLRAGQFPYADCQPVGHAQFSLVRGGLLHNADCGLHQLPASRSGRADACRGPFAAPCHRHDGLPLIEQLVIHLAERAFEHGRRGAFCAWWSATIALGITFLAGTAYEWRELVEHHGSRSVATCSARRITRWSASTDCM